MLGEFHRQKVSYCYWKSSRRLDAAFAGEGDIDLLVQSQDQHRVQAILLELDFKLFPSVTDRDHPGMLSFLGHDERSGQLIHIHLHFRLLPGESLLKNYRMPWEEVLLARAVLHPTLPIRILDPASEALLLVVRACIELRRLDLPTLRNWHATMRKFALDRAELATRVQRSMLRDLASELLSEHLAEIVTEAFYCERPLERQAGLRRLIGNHCAAYRSYNSVEARVRSAGRALLWAVGNLNKHVFHAPRIWSRSAPGGGCMVAIVGVDGSGKSTSLAAMRAWLGSKIDVVPIYFGTGDGRPSLLFRPFKLVKPLIVRNLKRKRRSASRGRISGHPPGFPTGPC